MHSVTDRRTDRQRAVRSAKSSRRLTVGSVESDKHDCVIQKFIWRRRQRKTEHGDTLCDTRHHRKTVVVELRLNTPEQVNRRTEIFLQRVSIACYADAVLAIVNPSVRPSVCLSHAGTVSIWHTLQSWGLNCRI